MLAQVVDVTWKLEWEADLTPADHDRLSGLLSAVYPQHRAGFAGLRSFSGARPEGRVVGYRDGQLVAHLGFLRRTLRVDDRPEKEV